MRDDSRRLPNGSENRFGAQPPSNGSNGVHPEGLSSPGIPLADVDQPIDLVAVQADDELINALAGGMSVSAPGYGGYDVDDHVAAILAAWKAEVDATPIPELVDVELAAATIAAATRPKIGRARHLAPVAAAAAVVVMAIGGLSVGSYSSEPGDVLWGVSKVLYSERAKSVEAAARVETLIDGAKRSLLKGDPEAATQQLQQAAADIATVRPEEGKDTLVVVQGFLAAKADETPPGEPAKLDAPLAKDPSKPVPPQAATMPPPPVDDPATTDPGTSAPGSTDPKGEGGTTSTFNPRSVDSSAGASAAATATSSPTSTLQPTTEGGPNSSGSATPTATSEGSPSTTTPSSMGTGEAGTVTPEAGASTPPS